MICVYTPDCTDFSSNGLGAVSPSSCTVTGTLNGEWELTLEHPLDAQGKWRRLIEGNILRAPVPAAMTPQVKLQGTGRAIYKVSTSRNPLRLRSGTGTKYRVLGLLLSLQISGETRPISKRFYRNTRSDSHGLFSPENPLHRIEE